MKYSFTDGSKNWTTKEPLTGLTMPDIDNQDNTTFIFLH